MPYGFVQRVERAIESLKEMQEAEQSPIKTLRGIADELERRAQILDKDKRQDFKVRFEMNRTQFAIHALVRAYCYMRTLANVLERKTDLDADSEPEVSVGQVASVQRMRDMGVLKKAGRKAEQVDQTELDLGLD